MEKIERFDEERIDGLPYVVQKKMV